MKERPIIFSTDMVKALIDGRKTQTRRIIKPQPDDNGVTFMLHPPSLDWEQAYNETWKPWHWETNEGEMIAKFTSPYGQPGDWLYVREAWAKVPLTAYRQSEGVQCTPIDDDMGAVFKAGWDRTAPPWKPSIHMPKKAARIWLEVTNVRVERLQEISEDDALAEGIRKIGHNIDDAPLYKDYLKKNEGSGKANPLHSFQTLWQSIHGPDSWEANPWLWVVDFEVLSTKGQPAKSSNLKNQTA